MSSKKVRPFSAGVDAWSCVFFRGGLALVSGLAVFCGRPLEYGLRYPRSEKQITVGPSGEVAQGSRLDLSRL